MTIVSRPYLKTEPLIFDFKNESAKIYDKFEIGDSMFSFFPTAEIQIKNREGQFSDFLYTENLKFDLRLYSEVLEDDRFLEHDFIWFSEEMPEPIFSAGKVTGTLLWTFVSWNRKIDRKKSKSYKGTIPTILSEILFPYRLKFTPATTLETPSNTGIYYQSNQSDFNFIRNTLTPQAYSISNPKSPYVSFINLKNEFYFITIEELFKRQQSVATLKFVEGGNEDINDFKILSFTQAFGGYEINKNNYIQNSFSFTDSYDKVEEKLEDRIFRGSKNFGKITAIKTSIDDDSHNDAYFGTETELFDEFNFKGFTNSLFKESSLNYRMTIMTTYIPEAISGKLIKTEVKGSLDDSLSTEFSGDWLILESQHGFSNKGDCAPFTKLTIAKNSLNVNPEHPFFNRYL